METPSIKPTHFPSRTIFRYLLSLAFTFILFGASAQSNQDAKEIIEQRIEELSAKTDMNYDFSELYDHFLDLYEHPIDINTADETQLRKLIFLNDNQIAILLAARRRNGGFRSIYELKDLPGFYVDLVLAIKPFITFKAVKKSEKIQFSKLLKYGKNQIIFRYGRVLEPQKGYQSIEDSVLAAHPNSRYLGNKNKLYFRYKYQYRDLLSFGILGDKDAGEEFFTGNNPYGFDFYSAHFFIRNQGKLKALALGDYHLEFGQGLSLWSGLAFGKSVTAIDIQRQARGLRPNTSANEVLFFRGAAATYAINKNIDFTAFYSNKAMDAGLSIRDTANTEELVFSSLQESGLHRTINEMKKKHSIREQIFGGNINYKNHGLRVGFTSYKTIYNKKLLKDGYPYQLYDFQGKENFNMGLNASYANRYLSAFGEVAMSANGGKALLIGSIFNLHPRLTFSLLYRNYQKTYQAFYAIPLSEGGKSQNEEGIYLGALLQLGNHSNLRFYYDIFKFPWLKYRVNAPSNGNEFSLQYERTPNRHFRYYFRYQYEDKMLNITDTKVAMTKLSHKYRHNIRLHLSYKVNHQLKLQSRLSLSHYQHIPDAASNGYLLFQDVQYSFNSIPLKFSLRYALFNTDDYNSRIYAYENDVLYKFTVPGYYYQGQRYYLLLNYKLNRALSFWFRIAQTNYFNRKGISANLEEINGSTRSEVTFQLRWKF